MKLRWVLIVVLLIIIFLAFPRKSSSTTPQTLAPSNEDVRVIIIEAAFRHDIDVQKFLKTAKCETKYRNIQSEIVKNGKREESYGIFQIHLPSHPTVTKEQALDPYFASEWSAKKFKENPRIWTCYRQLYGSNT